jgi:hypothetical protein
VSSGALRLTTEFADPRPQTSPLIEGITDIVFDGANHLYATDFWSGEDESAHELLVYDPVPVAELSNAKPVSCNPGVERESDATVDCGLTGVVEPWGVSETEAWFEFGSTPELGNVTAHQQVPSTGPEGNEEPPVTVTDPVTGLLPNQRVYYRIAANDHNAEPPETLQAEVASLTTPSAAPRIVGSPSATFVKAFSADIRGEVNPENSSTEYYAEYAPRLDAQETLAARCPGGVKGGEECEGVGSTPALHSDEYGPIAGTVEATGLQPDTTYVYRLFARNSAAQTALDESGGHEIKEGTFKTLAAPVPQAETGAATGVGTDSATVSGSVNPGGQPAVYTFQVGIYEGAQTSFGTVVSAPVAASDSSVLERQTLTGLQPGVAYAYRIGVSSAYGTSYGAAGVFTTVGLPAALSAPSSLALLPIPAIAFPGKPHVKKTVPRCKHGYVRGKHGKCVKAPRRKRAKKSRRRG